MNKCCMEYESLRKKSYKLYREAAAERDDLLVENLKLKERVKNLDKRLDADLEMMDEKDAEITRLRENNATFDLALITACNEHRDRVAENDVLRVKLDNVRAKCAQTIREFPLPQGVESLASICLKLIDGEGDNEA